MSIAPLHPTHATETAPIYLSVLIDQAGEEARAIVRNSFTGLDWRSPKYRTEPAPGDCTTCGATGKQRCREGGRFVGRHEGRAS